MTYQHNSDPPLLAAIEQEDDLDNWAEYLGGSWEQGDPDLPGIYAVASAEGHFVGYLQWDSTVKGGTIQRFRGHAEPPWQGYRWSCPLPPPPHTDKGITK